MNLNRSLSRRSRLLIAAALLSWPASQALAETGKNPETGGAEEQPAPDAAAHDHDRLSDDIVVSAHAMRDMGLMAGSIELNRDEIVKIAAPQIGDMLAKLPGVSATSFAPGASRPILRGLGGDRVKVLIDGLGSIDVSSVSADHGVALDTLAIDHIDVLHGPALLAYGGQAIGGAVNAIDKRIPLHIPKEPFELEAITGFESASDGKSAGGSVDLPIGQRFAVHLDASWHDSNDLRVGGDVVSPPLKAEALGLAAQLRSDGDAAEADEVEAAANARGRVPNSFAHGTDFGAGVAFIDDGGSLGLSVQRMDSRYGVPGRPGTGEQGVSIDLGQTRVDLRGHVKLGGAFDRLQIRGAYGDYVHDELEADGSVGTRFARKGIETRLELIQADNGGSWGGWTGRTGLQYSWGTLKVTGEEAILPDNSDNRLGVFTLQSVKLGQIDIDAAGRIEHVSIDARQAGFDRGFTLYSAAAGLGWRPTEGMKLGVNWSHGERAPSPEELLTDGLHIATQSYEIGNAGFGKERSNGVEAYVRYDSPNTRLSLTGYLTRFKGFVTPVPTGDYEEGFPIYLYRQLPARFRGLEAQASQKLAAWGESSLTADASADYVHADLEDNGPVPHIPPLRVQGGLEYAVPGLSLRGEVEWNDAQKRVGPNEYPTSAFTLVNASATWQPMGREGPLTLILAANNIFDVLGRSAASFTRDFVPIAGRDIRMTAKISL